MSLLKAQPVRGRSSEPHPATAPVKPARAEGLPFKQAFELLDKAFPGTQAIVTTALPRGSFQVAQPGRIAEGLLKGYVKQFHLEDRLTWQAIVRREPFAGSEVLRDEDQYLASYLRENGLAYAAVAPLAAPVLDGYPGAVHVYRTAEQGDFSAEDLRKLGELAKEIDDLLAKARATRQGGGEEVDVMLTPRPAGRLFVFDAGANQLVPGGDFEVLDLRLREEIVAQVKARLGRLNGELIVSGDRMQLADSRGDLWTFRAVTYPNYPAVGDGPYVVITMQPNCNEWAAVRPNDFSADQELARLIPALRFMRQEFHRGPTLTEIAKQVHLSPFHFHRRFAELLGLTPKHYLLECQINEAKIELLARRKELSQIATDCGFAHQSHFTSRFKQATGLTPTRWRRLATDARE